NFASPENGRVSALLFQQGYEFLDIETGKISKSLSQLQDARGLLKSGQGLARTAEGRRFWAGGGGALGIALGLGIGLGLAFTTSTSFASGTLQVPRGQHDIEAARTLRASATTESSRSLAKMITEYSSLLIDWTLEEEIRAKRVWFNGSDGAEAVK